MTEIIPAIIGEDFAQVKEKIEKVKGLVNWIQLDVVDGVFAEPESWGVRMGQNLDLWEPTDLPKIEMHFMVKNPAKFLDDWVSTSVDRILIHVESEGSVAAMIKKVKDAGTQVGLVLKTDTDIAAIDTYANDLDAVQLMSIDTIGNYGAVFSRGAVDRIKKVRERYPNLTIGVDGGVTLDNAQSLIDAGANNLVVGSAIFKSGNVEEAIQKFKAL